MPEDIEQLLEISSTRPEVLKGLLLKEQVAYQLAWHKLVNPDSLPISVLDVGIGAELITVLGWSNAATVHGVDLKEIPKKKEFEMYMRHWDIVDTDPITLPPVGFRGIERTDPEKNPDHVRMVFDRQIKGRCTVGYWDATSTMPTWGYTRCVVIELKRMGVDPKRVTFDEGSDESKLTFYWAFPGEKEKERTVLYNLGDIKNWVGKLPKVDCYYQKAVWSHEPLAIPNIPSTLNEDGLGKILLGYGNWASTDKAQRTITRHEQALKPEFRFMDVPEGFTRMMLQKYSDSHGSNEYCWRLYGFFKTKDLV